MLNVIVSIVIATLVAGSYYAWTWRRPQQIALRLSMRPSERPQGADFLELWRYVRKHHDVDVQNMLYFHIKSLRQRFGDDAIRCAHLAIFWYMAMERIPWTLELPRCTDEQTFEEWLEGRFGLDLSRE